MLKGLTSTFKDGCNNVELTYKEYVKLENDIIPVKATLKDDCYENGNFIGTFILKEIQFETEATYEFRNKEFEYYKEVDGESIKIGTFISTDITINDTTEIVKVVGMDYGLKTQVEYTSALDYASGEITLKDVWDECCTLSGLESGIEDFANSDFIVDSDQFSGTGAMIRDVFKGIAMSSGSFVKVMNDDKVYLVFNELTSEKEELEIDGSASADDVLKIDGINELEGNTIQKNSTLPSGYTQLDYIESTGTQYINTGVVPTANTKIDIDFMYLDSVYNSWVPLYGERTSLTGGNFALYIYRPDGRLSPNYGTFDPGGSSTKTISNNVKYNVKTDGGNFYLDDTLISSCSTSSTFNSSDRSIWLFDIQQQNGTPQSRGMKARIYHCKFYESTTLIRDLIPCYRNSDNVIGMYDLVNNTFYNNIGTGTFNYGGIPNPDNPVPVNVVSGRQEVDIVGKNLYTTGTGTSTRIGVEATYNKSEFTLNGTTTSSGNIFYDSSISLNTGYRKSQRLVAGTYTLTLLANKSITFPSGTGMAFYIRNGNARVVLGVSSLNRSYQFTLNEDTDIYSQLYCNASGIVFDNVLFKVQIEKGSTASEYEEYKSQSYEINLGKNLLPYQSQDFTINNVRYYCNNGNLYLYGTSTGETNRTNQNFKDNFAFYLDAGTYTFKQNILDSGNASYFGKYISKYDDNSSLAYINNTKSQTTFTLTERTRVYFSFYVYQKTFDNETFNIQLEKGSQATSYSPYKTPIELCKIGTYQDRIYKENGTWYIEKQIGKVVLDGSETYGVSATYTNNTRFTGTNLFLNLGKTTKLISDYFIEGTGGTDTTNIDTNGNSGQLMITIPNSIATSVNQLTTWLNTHNTTIYYILATPTTTEITDTELISQLNAIELLEGTNNISITSSDLTGKLKLTYYNNDLDIIEDYVELEDKRDTHPWTCLRLGMSNIEGENVDYIDEDLVEQYGENWLILNDNPFAYNQEKRQQLIVAIFNQIKAFGYSAFVSKVAFKPYLTSGDIIHFRNREKELVKSIVLRYTHSGEEITIEAPSETSATVNYIYPLGAIDIAKQTQIIVDKDSVRIDSLTSQTQTIQDDLRQNYYTLEQTNQLVQTASTGLTNTFSEAGGNNIFRNTGLWFGATTSKATLLPSNDLYPSDDLFMGNEVAYEFWEGLVKRIKEDKASNMVAMSLQNGYFSQEQLVPNGKYTVSFKYNRVIALTTAKVFINDVEYLLNGVGDTEFTQIIEVNSQHINIKFYCSIDDGCEIYDLMVNAGEVKLAYSQNQNETTTDTVNISKGITITSSDTDVKFKADSDGIRTLDNNNNVLTEFTDEGMKTKTAIIESKSQIVGTLWQEVNGQTWITRL